MAWEMVGKPEVFKVTKTLAKEFAEMEACLGDRPLSEKREASLRKQVEEKKFRSADWSMVYCEETKRNYRVNGKHTSTLFAKIYESEGGAVEKLGNVKVVVTRYIAETLVDVADLYSTFDAKVSVRSPGDINLTFSATDERLSVVPRQTMNLCVSSLAYVKWGPRGLKSAIPQSDKAHNAMDHADLILWVSSIFKSGKDADARSLKRLAVVTAMFACYRRSQEQATTFWTAVMNATDPDRDTPARTLNRFLIQSSADLGRGASSGKKHVGFREMYDKCVHAWNAFRAGKASILLKHVPDADPPRAR